jgi:nitrate reductase NapE component
LLKKASQAEACATKHRQVVDMGGAGFSLWVFQIVREPFSAAS